MKYRKLMASMSVMALATMHAATAYAQAADQPAQTAENDGIAEIVVTAQKRSETLGKSAAAISVIGQKTMDDIGARSFKEAVSSIPSVSANGLGGTIAIRGLGTALLQGKNGTVAYHTDGIYQPDASQSGARLFDIARVEVLRGPQGTLYGRNATAGVVNVITNNANTEALEAFGDVSYERWNSWVVRGAVNVPISDAFAVRLTGTYENSDDFKRLPNGDHPDKVDALNLRLAWRVKPSDSITWDARVAYNRQESVLEVAVPTYFFQKSTNTLVRGSNPRDLAAVPPGTGTDGLAFLNLTGLVGSAYKGLTYEEANMRPTREIAFRSNLNIELSDAISLTYLLGYARKKEKAGVIAGLQPFQANFLAGKSKTWSNELNLSYNSDDLHAILGAYAYQEVADAGGGLTRVFAASLDPVTNLISFNIPLQDQSAMQGGHERFKTRAIFGQATVDVTDAFRVTGGARYNWDRASFPTATQSSCPFGSGVNGNQPNVALLGPLFGPLASFPVCSGALLGVFTGFGFPPSMFALNRVREGGSKTFEKFSWKGTLDYDVTPDTLVYATVATGYKAGGPGDTGAVGDDRFFRPETNINYEAGLRTKLFDNTLSLNLTAFWTDYKNLQIQSTKPGFAGQLFSTNLGKSRSRGVEFEYVWAPTAADRINGYVSYLDTEILDFPSTDELTEEVKNFAGNRLPGAPKFSARISYSHTFDLGSAGTITPTISSVYQSKTFLLFTNSLPSEVDGHTRSDLIVRYETANKRISVEGYVNNIENKIRNAYLFPYLGVSNVFVTPPRSYGVRLGFRY